MSSTIIKQEYTSNIKFANIELFRHICGIEDTGVNKIEMILDLSIIPRGYCFLIKASNKKTINRAELFFEQLQNIFQDNQKLPDEFDLKYLLKSIDGNKNGAKDTTLNNKTKKNISYNAESEIFVNFQGHKVYARTHKQSEFVSSILNDAITLCIGPAGTGKTFLSVVVACHLFKKGLVERIVLTRPAVEAGESLGFLPGDLTQKVDPYLRPLFDSLYECLGYDKVHDLINLGKIEIAPLAFMRGRTLNNSVIILDEAQNCTLPQLKMFLTRIGRNSRMCISGDNTQTDLGIGKSGLIESSQILKNIAGIGIIQFGLEDIVRHPLVEKIVAAFNKSES